MIGNTLESFAGVVNSKSSESWTELRGQRVFQKDDDETASSFSLFTGGKRDGNKQLFGLLKLAFFY